MYFHKKSPPFLFENNPPPCQVCANWRKSTNFKVSIDQDEETIYNFPQGIIPIEIIEKLYRCCQFPAYTSFNFKTEKD